jgi:DNA-directed RNA polymerase subunit RPC12/RpoP
VARLPGIVGSSMAMPGEDRDIRCPSCGHEVVTRTVHPPRTDLDDSRCPRCSTPIPGRFTPP